MIRLRSSSRWSTMLSRSVWAIARYNVAFLATFATLAIASA